MINIKSIKALSWAFLIVPFLFSCNSTEKSFTKSYTKIVLEAEAFDSVYNWSYKEYYTGNSILAENGVADSNEVSYTINIAEPGEYRIGAMAANRSYPVENGQLILAINDKEVGTLQVENARALIWTSFIPIQVTDTGNVTLKVISRNEENTKVYIDQLVLTDDPNFQPKGYEYDVDTIKAVLPPAWAFGVLYGGYTNQEETIERVNRLIDEDYPIDGYWIDSWFWNYYNEGRGPEGYIDFEGDPESYPNPREMWDIMKANNIKSGIWIWDAIQQSGNEEAYQEFLDKGLYRRPPSLNTNGWHNKTKNTMMGDIDFSNPEAVALWREKMKPFFDQGVDFIKLDKSSKIDYMKTVFEATQELGQETKGRGFIMSHLHTTHDPRMKLYPTKWSGDAKIAWEQPDAPNMGNYSMGALKENIMMVANPNRSTYEVPFMTSDLGGYNYFGSTEQSDSLYIRWTQFAMFNPITTAFSTADSPNSNMPFNFSEQSQKVFKYYAELKHQLFPYIYTYAHLTRETGEKMIQGDGTNLLQYQFGDELLVAPVLREEFKKVYLPEGEWYEFYSDELIKGGQTFEVRTDIEKIPLFVKSGSIIPMRNATQQIETASNETLILHLYPGDKAGSFTIYEDDGASNDYLNGQVAKTTFQITEKTDTGFELKIKAVEGNYNGRLTQRNYEIIVHGWSNVRSVDLKNKVYDEETRQLSFEMDEVNTSKMLTIQVPLN